MSIWNIKNRWLRAGVAWGVAAGMVVFVAGAFIVTAFVGAIRGLWEGPAEFIDDFDEWSELGSDMWAAMTAQEARK